MPKAIRMKPTSVIKARLGLQKGGPVHKFFTDTCYNHMDKYVPKRKGILRENVTYGTEGSSIIYLQEYAEYQYYGQRRDGTHQVKRYTTGGTGPYWDKRMWSAEKDVVLSDVQKFIEKRGK